MKYIAKFVDQMFAFYRMLSWVKLQILMNNVDLVFLLVIKFDKNIIN